MRRIQFSFLALTIACGALVPSALAEDSPLDFFPESTALVIRLNEPDKTIDKTADFVDAIQPGTGQIVGAGADQLGEAISNPQLVGVDHSRPWYVGVVLSEDGPPVPMFVIPATEPEAFVDAIDEQMNAQAKGDWVIYVEKPAELPEVGLTKVTSKLNGEAAKVFAGGDLSLFVDVAKLTETYEEPIEELKDKVNDGMNALQLNAPPNVDVGALIQMYSEFAHYGFRILEDSSHLAIAVNIGSEGLRFEDYLVVKTGSASDKWIAAHPAGELPLLKKLPEGQHAYYGVSGMTSSMMRFGMKYTQSMLKSDNEDFDALIEKLGEAKIEGLVGSMRMGGTSFISGTGVFEGELGNDFKDTMRKLQAVAGEYEVNGVKQTIDVQRDAEKVGDNYVDVVTVKQEVVDPSVDPTGIQKNVTEKLFGADGMQTRSLYTENRVVSTVGSLDDLKGMLEELEGDDNKALTERLERLPSPANFIGLMDLAGFYGEIFKIIGSAEGLPFELEPSLIDNLNMRSSYVGFAAVTEPHAARCRFDVPVEQVQNCIKLGTVLFVTIRQQQQGF
ncbi:MAG: hypothetical protein R3C18_08075 [Planctomycetaceae bacterium]